eukprot:COSAG02_NODE_1028_length_15086_cov_21.563555_3_plen_235_part_00
MPSNDAIAVCGATFTFDTPVEVQSNITVELSTGLGRTVYVIQFSFCQLLYAATLLAEQINAITLKSECCSHNRLLRIWKNTDETEFQVSAVRAPGHWDKGRTTYQQPLLYRFDLHVDNEAVPLRYRFDRLCTTQLNGNPRPPVVDSAFGGMFFAGSERPNLWLDKRNRAANVGTVEEMSNPSHVLELAGGTVDLNELPDYEPASEDDALELAESELDGQPWMHWMRLPPASSKM